MAACPAAVPTLRSSRGRYVLTQSRLAANRRNAARSTGPRTAEGKARVARNAVKHGFFAAIQRWSPEQHRDYADLLEGLRNDFKPASGLEEVCIATMAESWVRMASVMRYENVAALEYHQRKDREIDDRIAATDSAEAARLEAHREQLRRAGLWKPSLPGPRETNFVIRCMGNLDRRIAHASSVLRELQSTRIEESSSIARTRKQSHWEKHREALRRTSDDAPPDSNSQKQTHSPALENELEIAKTNPLNSMFMGNRHERRRAKALARKGAT